MPHSTGTSIAAATSTVAEETCIVTEESTHIVLDSKPTSESTPYWLVNVPRAQWPAECPDFLRNLRQKNIQILSTPDELYVRPRWETVMGFVFLPEANQIDSFQRLPSDLRKYFEYTAQIKAQYGSVMRFIVKERLHWGDGSADDLKPRGRPFEFDDDIKILYNDWPYGVEKGIVHLVVWVKFELEDKPGTDELTPKARKEIGDYVQRTFCSRISPEQVVWFKNWKSLKSVHAVEHFHVMLNNPDPDFVRDITEGDIPMIKRIEAGSPPRLD